MAVTVADGLAICVDCLQLISNGELTDSDGNDIAAEHAEKIAAIWKDGRLVGACPEGCEGWFSWSDCDGCGSTLGGDRHPAVVFED